MMTMLPKLYNREEDIAKLVDAYENYRRQHSRPSSTHLVLSVGPAGCGKTCLIQKALIPWVVDRDRGYFVQGRFDHDLDRPEPFAPWIDATEQLLEQLIDRCDKVELAAIIQSVHQCMEVSDMKALAILVPLFGDLMNLKANDDQAVAAAAAAVAVNAGPFNFLLIFGSFLRAVTHPSRPMVWFLDNLHHADDASSLEVVKLLVANTAIFTVVAFRPVSTQHPTSVLLQTLEVSGVGMIPIIPTPMDYASIYEWLESYNMKGLTDYQKDQISTTIAEGTDEGNALAVHLCLSIMNWNQEIVQETGGTPLQAGADITKLFPLLFQMLSKECQTLCSTAACMGTVVDIPHLAEILGDGSTDYDIPLLLAEAEQYGILEFQYYDTLHSPPASSEEDAIEDEEEKETDKAPTTTSLERKLPGELHDLQRGEYRFANTSYRELLYNMLTPDERKMKHTAIGMVFRQHINRVGIFRVVVHMALAGDNLAPKAKELLIGYCVEAGRRARQWNALVMSAKYLQLGISLLVDCTPRFWKTHASLITDLYCDTAQVASQLGKYPEMDALLGEAMNHAKDPSHKLLATQIQMEALIVQMKYSEAIIEGLAILKKNGEPLRWTNTSVNTELKAVRKLLLENINTDGSTGAIPLEDCSLLTYPPMTDPKILGTMQVMGLLIAPLLILQGDLIPLLVCRMVKLTYKHGVASSSPLALCCLGVVLCLKGEIELGVWCSDTGMTLVESIHDKASKGRVMTIHWGLLSRFVKPWRICQEPLKLAYRECIKSGDSEFSMICPVLSTMNMLAAGGPLPPIAEAMKSVYQLLQRKNQDTLQRILRPFYQLILNLMGVSPEVDASVLTGTIMKEADDLRFLQEHPSSSREIECCLLWCQAVVNFYLHKFGRAREMLENCRALFQKYPHALLGSMQISLEFWNAMTAVRLLWWYKRQAQDGVSSNVLTANDKKRQTQLLAAVKESLEVLQTLSSHSSENVEHKVLMVQGQLQALEGNTAACMELFQRAIDMADQNGSIADKALFGEHAGLTLRMCAEEDHALDYLEDCCTSYRDWGALIKVNHVKGTVIPEAGGVSTFSLGV